MFDVDQEKYIQYKFITVFRFTLVLPQVINEYLHLLFALDYN